ncbi:MAG TPA: histidine kinase [Thermoanaerobaculia bacterium]|nr:histidine kinase [Thermoanaerobaculia bacterium]
MALSSIRSRLALLAVAVALPLLALLGWMFFSQLRSQEIEARESSLRVARLAASTIATMHGESATLLDRMAEREAIRTAQTRQCDSLFAIVDFFPHYVNLFQINHAGELICSASPQPDDLGVSTDAAEWITATVKSGSLPMGSPLVRPIEGRWISVLAEEVPGVGKEDGSILALVLHPGIETGLAPGTVMTLMNAEGVILARSAAPESWSGRAVRGTEVTEIVLRERDGQTEAIGIDGVSRQYGFTSVPGTGWSIYVGVPTDEVMQPVRDLFFRGAVAGLVIVLIALASALAFARSIERPIGMLVAAAGEVAQTGRTRRLPAEGPREVALLSEAFHEMVERRSRAEGRLVESERNLKALSDRILTVQEEQRRRIARELHDDLGQSLTALKMDVGGLLRLAGDEPATSTLRERIRQTLDATVDSVQRIAAELRPPVLDDLGLRAVLESDAQIFEERTGIECELSIAEESLRLDPRTETALYRIIQEALTNVARHSDASRVEIRIRNRHGELLLDVRDDGRGVTGAELEGPAALGLLGIRERAAMLGGTAHIEGVEGSGTIVSLRVPVAQPAVEGGHE